MRFKLTIVLLLANLVVFYALWRLERTVVVVSKPSGLVDFLPNHITIKDNVLNEVRELTQEPGEGWQLTQPMKWAANDNAVDQLTDYLAKPDQLSSFSMDEMSGGGDTLAEYGLDKPRAEITITGAGGKNVTIQIGSGTPAGNNLYVLNPADREVRVWTQNFYNYVETPVSELCDKGVFSINVLDVNDLSIWSVPASDRSQPGGVVTAPNLVKFSRDSANKDYWQLDTPLKRPANTRAVNTVVQQLNNLQAVSFLSGAEANPARLGLANTTPALRIELKGADGRSQTLVLGDPVPNTTGDPQFYAKREDSDTIFKLAIPKDLLATLSDAQKQLRERHFLDFDPDKVTALTLQDLDIEVKMLKTEDGHWQIAPGASGQAPLPADKQVIMDLLGDLRNLSAKSFATDAPDDLQSYGLTKPVCKVTLHMDKTTLELDIGHMSGPTRYYAKLSNSDSVYEIDGDIAGELAEATEPLYFRERTLENLPAAAKVVSFKLTHLKEDGSDDGAPIINLVPDAGKSLGDKLSALSENQQINLKALFDWLHVAPVDRVLKTSFDEHSPYLVRIGDSPIPTPAPWRYRLDASLQLPAAGLSAVQNQSLVFYFTDEIGSRRFAGTHTPEAIVDLPLAVVALLKSLTGDFNLPPEAQRTVQGADTPIDPRNLSAPPATSTGTAAPSTTTAKDAAPTVATPAASASTTTR